jgi:tetratricopeptide (TPR) repeat protein
LHGAIAFVGRDAALDRLHDLLQQETPVAICAVSGMGGIGKTELALQYALKHRDLGTYPGGICWLRARQEIKTQLVEFARSRLGLDLPLDLELDAKVRQCWQDWREGETLIIFDDVQQYDEIRDSLPPGRSRFKVLLTTRLRLGRSFRELHLEVLSEAAALDLLRSIVNQGRESRDPRLLEEVGDLEKQLCQWLGYLPLGLELVARYLAKKQDVSLPVLWERLQAQQLEARAFQQTEPGMTAPLGVAAAFELSWQDLNEPAQQLAGLLSLFAAAPIPWELVKACLPDWDEEDLEDVRDDRLLGLHLLQRTEQALYQLHPLLRSFFAAKREQRADVDEVKQTFCQAMVAVAEHIPQTPTLSLIEQITPAIPHLKEAATTFAPWLTDAALIMPSTHIGWFYEGQAAYAEAEEWKKQCRAIATQRLGADHPDVATTLNNLADFYRAQGRYGEAEPLFQRALVIGEQQLGSDHPVVATWLNNLALLYQAQGRYGEAEPLYQRALAIGERQLGSDHPAVATRLNNLASLYRAQGRYEEAEPLYQRALAIGERQLGSDHPAVATRLNNLASLYQAQGRYGEAEPLYQRALAIGAQQLGSDHPAVAIWLNNLANLYYEQGRYGEAERFYLQALPILFEKLGANHPNTKTVGQNFRLFLQAVVRAQRLDELSDDPATQDLLRELQEGCGG